MNIQFKQILRQLFRLINRLSLIEKLLYSFLLVVAVQAVVNWITRIFREFANYISLHYQTLILALVAIFGVFLFVAGCFLYFKRGNGKQSQADEYSEDDDTSLLEASVTNKSQSIYAEGNYIQGDYKQNIQDYVEIHGDQININADWTDIVAKLCEMVDRLKNRGYSQEDAEEDIASKLEEKSSNNPRLRQKLY